MEQTMRTHNPLGSIGTLVVVLLVALCNNHAVSATPVDLPSPLLLPPMGAYDFAGPIVYVPSTQLRNFSLRLPDNSLMPPAANTAETISFNATVRTELSTDAGASFQHVSVPANVAVQVTADASGMNFNTEMLSLDLSGGGLPGGVMVRESPTLASTGATSIQDLGDGLFRIDSFFDVFTELSTDGGASWQPANSAAHGILKAPSAEVSFPTPLLPPPTGTYAGDRVIQFPDGSMLRNLVLSNPTQSASPPAPGGNIISTGNFTITGELAPNLAPFAPFSATASFQEHVVSQVDNGNTRFFDTEMLALDISGGTLPAGVLLRESPTKASTGRTAIRSASDSTSRIGSFFDVFTELSTDGGASWQPANSECVFALAQTFNLSGLVRTSNLTPVALVNVNLAVFGGASLGNASTDSSGLYNFTGLLPGLYTLTPTMSGFTFTPSSQGLRISAADRAANFVATPSSPVFSVSGHISNFVGTAIPNVSVAISPVPAGVPSPLLTNSAGYFTFTNVPDGSYTVTPTLVGATFTPPSKNPTVSGANVTGQNFIAHTGHNITGRIATSSGAAIANVSVALSPATGVTTPVLTNSAGYYTLYDVPDGNYTVTPTKAGLTFTPPNKMVNINGADVSGQNFTGS
jgi:hypothetical protein